MSRPARTRAPIPGLLVRFSGPEGALIGPFALDNIHITEFDGGPNSVFPL